MAKWVDYFKIVEPAPERTKMTDSQEMADQGAYNNYTWYQRLVQGSASRMTRYREYDLMDNDVDVFRALDTIAEEMTGNNPKTNEPIMVDIQTEDEAEVDSNTVLTVKTALRRWNRIHDWENRLFKVARMTVKYGDVFFRKDPDSEHGLWFGKVPGHSNVNFYDGNDSFQQEETLAAKFPDNPPDEESDGFIDGNQVASGRDRSEYLISKFGDDKAQVLNILDPFKLSWQLRGGMQHLLVDYITDSGLVHDLAEVTTEYSIALMEKAKSVGVDVIALIGDLASEKNTIFSPEQFREFLQPYYIPHYLYIVWL